MTADEQAAGFLRAHENALRILASEQSPLGVDAQAVMAEYDRRGKEIERLRADVADRARLTTLGGPPPRPSTSWGNPRLPVDDVHVDYRGRL